ncbi:MAG: hypothetical protein JSR62_06565 [Nitrospira sp.]|nr:hypothetical protein [Nitrospira sp.]
MYAKVVGSIAAAVMIVLGGCGLSKPTMYPGTAGTPDLQEAGIVVLGGIEGCRGAYCPSADGEGGQELPLALTSAPPASSYHALLLKRAAAQFHVPAQDLRLGEVTVRYYRELDGTITGWKATAQVGRSASK